MCKCKHRSVCTRYRVLKKTCVRSLENLFPCPFYYLLWGTYSTSVGMSVGLISSTSLTSFSIHPCTVYRYCLWVT